MSEICSILVVKPPINCWTVTDGARLQLVGLLAQQMICVCEQFRYGLRFSGIVITADLTAPIHQHHPCAVHGNSPFIAAIFFFSSRRRHTRSVSAFLLNRSSDLSSVSGGSGAVQMFLRWQ